ncbi:hypothetical protein B0H10DRAFT_1939463 [Mycena sp. CBHHK59/15]|nr:hypothetical protein B0H10DRAFT_1939463 [Mycena sp. CBHHK59/15]
MSSHLSFPQNINHPQPVGRGEHESRPMPRLQNHLDARRKNRQKGERAVETRRLNGTTGGQRAVNASETPPTANASNANTSNAHTAAPQTPSTIPARFLPQSQSTRASISPSPQLFPAPHQSSSPVPAHPCTPPSLVPQDYQPVYPNFQQLPGSGSQITVDNGVPNVSSFSITPEHFKRMMDQMSSAQRPEFNQFLDMGRTSTGSDWTSTDSRDHSGSMWDSINKNNDWSGDLRPFDMNDSASPVGDRDDDPPAQDMPWNSTLANDNEEYAGLHQNAQSSLEVEMHDVDVQRRKRKHCVAQVSDPDRRRIIEAGYQAIERAVCLEKPWPIASPSGDPAADDDEFDHLIDDAWDAGVDAQGLDPDLFDAKDTTPMERKLVCHISILISSSQVHPSFAGASHVHSDIMKEADRLVRGSYGFVDILSLADCTPKNIQKMEEANRQLVADLHGKFMYKDPHDTSDIATMCRHPIFQKLLVACFFAPKGINRCGFFFNGKEMLPLETMGLFMDVVKIFSIICGIDRWKTGRHTRIDFDAEIYGGCGHEDSVSFLEAWMAEYKVAVYPVNLAEACLREMLSNAHPQATLPKSVRGGPRSPLHVSNAHIF